MALMLDELAIATWVPLGTVAGRGNAPAAGCAQTGLSVTATDAAPKMAVIASSSANGMAEDFPGFN
jgi:hypothetical protein